MADSTGGSSGKRTATTTATLNTQQTAPQTAQPVQNVQNVPQSMSTDFNKFMTMTDDDKADVIADMVKQGVPAHLSDTAFQSFIYNIGLNDKPQLVDDATLDAMSGKDMFRTVNAVYDSVNDINYRADEIIKQIQGGRVTRTSDNGGSVYGRGLYFADGKSASTSYGRTRGDVKKTAVVRMKLNNNANVVSHNTVMNGVSREMVSGSKLGKVLSRLDNASAESIWALTQGYNVIASGHGYFNVLNRQAITMSKTISAI